MQHYGLAIVATVGIVQDVVAEPERPPRADLAQLESKKVVASLGRAEVDFVAVELAAEVGVAALAPGLEAATILERYDKHRIPNLQEEHCSVAGRAPS